MIDWIDEFSPAEWPGDCTKDMDPLLFNECLFPLRLNSGVAMTPSPLLEGHVRQSGDSRHSLKGGQRKSDGSDLFIRSDKNIVARVHREALRIQAIGGFGIYFDTKPSVMIHVDHRPERIVWIRVDGDYIYEVNDPAFFYSELASQLERLK